MVNYGKILREIRTSRGMNLDETADDIISTGFLSKIERGESVPNFDIFLRLLERLRVDFNEFTFLTKNEFKQPYAEFQTELALATVADDAGRLSDLVKVNQAKYNKTNNLVNRHQYITAQLAYQAVKKEKFDVTMIAELKQYLLNVDNWERYELRLFNNNLNWFDLETVNLLSKTAINRSQNVWKVDENNTILVYILLNTAELQLQKKQITELNATLSRLSMLMVADDVSVAKVKFNYLRGMLKIVQGNVEAGKLEVDKAVEVLRYFHAYDWASGFEKFYEDMLKESGEN